VTCSASRRICYETKKTRLEIEKIEDEKTDMLTEGVRMDWRIFLTTFGTIFLAEMGDKTQLAAMTMAAETKKPLTVFVSAALALVCVSAIGVAVGGMLGHYLPVEWIRRVAAVGFIVIGVLILLDKF
jgi:putative Ca2+/H+ antiporter (TMEM165/GDT1 family)